MGFFNGLRPDTVKGQPELARQSVDEKTDAPIVLPADQSKHIKSVATEDIDNDELVHTDMQTGVQKIEGMAQVWPRWALYFTYAWVWIIYFIDALEGPTGWTLAPYVTSKFSLHGLTAITGVVAQLVGGLARLPLAKLIDVWGRPEGLAICVVLMTVGSIMMAATDSVQMYAAAEVFSQTAQEQRLIFAYIASPYLITTFTSGYFANAMLEGPGWRWAFGVFSILHPVLNAPLIVILLFYQHKAFKQGIVPIRDTGRTKLQAIKFYARECDAFGLFLIISLPLSGATLDEQWSSPLVLSMLIIGFVLIVAFVIWEWKFAPVTFIPFHLLRDRTILGCSIIAAILFVEFYIWNTYFSSFLQVVPGLDVVQTGYILNIYSMGSCFWSFIAGLVLRYTGDFKWQALFFGMPLTFLGVVLMIVFRQPDVNIGYIVMCQLFIAFGGGTLVIAQQVGAMAATTHQYIAVVLAILSVFNAIGGAIGASIAGAVWGGTFTQDLARFLPPETKANSTIIAGDITVQLSYALGDPTRIGIQNAYGNSQRIMLIAATAITALGFPAVAMWRAIDTRKRKQVKGRVL
ncbi:Siderophore iron transporter mirB [Cyphellophora attinorum]|uniref:Siderophore iron transporter mirB n=1 Tax=Cyphellophora attinorum TaxID=1664694 RepID=A0A0N1GXI8_9EURO|nr:Siderophore iron transporter mirB [Phialophora attinorum]KPI35064.1 Siderophore iron transporter mirB [Phialophora attinorum]